MTPEEIARFISNVIEARENGYEEVCAECGVGIYDEMDIHERDCSRYVDYLRKASSTSGGTS